ncbi:hypothetical protein RYZ26_19145 [Terasakiella sp. A23]|uniref:hypothetical protein n=1 Tax=Terasakiella sp. FCG-A23 TaxID=3080561 RepID=UPI002955C482|nr:hypothetical protein [Terasakiella sp. A23]MDV7341726.1 hypothetical protein [Terasakiella sp. A23]
MKMKSIAALLGVGVLVGACFLEGVTAGAVLGFIANNATRVGETAEVVKSAIERYKESETRMDKIRVLADVSCYLRENNPDQMDYLRGKLKEAGVSDQIADAARRLADKKCGLAVKVEEKAS